MKHRYLSRSALVQWRRCPRLGYYTNVYGGMGVVSKTKSTALSIGTANHAGVQTLLTGLKNDDVDVDLAVAEALATYKEEIKPGLVTSRGRPIPERFVARVMRENQAIIEAAVRLFAAVRLPTIHEKYEILEVEAEHTIRLTPDLTLVSRPDAVFEHRFSGWLDVFSLKNPGAVDYRKVKDATVDMQGLSESFAVAYDYPDRHVNNVMMEHIVVGKEMSEEEEDGSGDDVDYPVRRTPLVRGWLRTLPSGTYEVAWRYEYENPNFDPAKPRKTGNFKNTRLSSKQGWSPVVAYDYPGGVTAWVRDLAAGLFIPKYQNPANEIFIYPPPYERRPAHIDRWLTQIIHEQTEISSKIEKVEAGIITLDQAFPMYEHSCYYPARCPFVDVCWKGRSIDDPALFEPRTPHHAQETSEPPED